MDVGTDIRRLAAKSRWLFRRRGGTRSKFIARYECLLSAGIAHVSACVNAKNGATMFSLPRSRERPRWGLLPARCRPEVDAAIGGVAINFTELVRRKRQL